MSAFPLAILAAMLTATIGAITKQRMDSEAEGRIFGGSSEVCYEEVGCYTTAEPWSTAWYGERPSESLPYSPDALQIEFRFFAPGHNDGPQYISLKNFSNWDIQNSGFKSSVKTKFIIHGYNGNNAQWTLDMKDAMIAKDSCNVFIVDWYSGGLYAQAANNIRVVGAVVGLFIIKLIDTAKLNPQDVHIIGHSLGAHTSGYAGKFVQGKNEKNKLGRITGLDPAGPYFNSVPSEVRLDKGDAGCVDVIHTDAAYFTIDGFGLQDSIGHFDFFPNGGKDQPGCMQPLEAAMQFSSSDDVVSDVACSHSRAAQLFTSTIPGNGCELTAFECSSYDSFKKGECNSCQDNKCVVMGYHVDKYKDLITDQTINFFLDTTSTAPFC